MAVRPKYNLQRLFIFIESRQYCRDCRLSHKAFFKAKVESKTEYLDPSFRESSTRSQLKLKTTRAFDIQRRGEEIIIHRPEQRAAHSVRLRISYETAGDQLDLSSRFGGGYIRQRQKNPHSQKCGFSISLAQQRITVREAAAHHHRRHQGIGRLPIFHNKTWRFQQQYHRRLPSSGHHI